MASKILTTVLIVSLALALVGGSAYILLQPAGADASRHAQSDTGSTGQAQNRGGQGASDGGVDLTAGHGQSGAGSAGRAGNKGGQGSTDAGADHPLETWTTIIATVTGLDGNELALQSTKGPFVVDLGPEWYWESNGIALNVGDEVDLSGFDEDGTFQVTRIDNLTTGQTALLRDETGRPSWAGRGRGGE